MRLTKKEKEHENIISDRSMRDKCVERYEVLEDVRSEERRVGKECM